MATLGPSSARTRTALTALTHSLLFASLVGPMTGCGGREARRASRTPVTVANAERRSVPYEIDASGTVEPVASADVTAQVGGLVTAIAFREGEDRKSVV